MPQFLILADDFTDDDALTRRMAARQQHLDRMAIEKAKGNFEVGGAKLNDQGKMFGSMLVINAENEAAAKEWIDEDPYVKGNVWDKIIIIPFRVANVQ